jgi:radical SAM superfamily enzyme YgiQ (UPF0313 family)
MRETLLFLQLPQLDNDVSDAHENHYRAAAYLTQALRQSPVGTTLDILQPPPEWDSLGDDGWIRAIESLRPHYLVATVYLWNCERTVALVRRLKERLPTTKMLLGGPDIAFPHPFLFRSKAADIVAMGEGERLLPEIIQSLRAKRNPDRLAVAWRTPAGWQRGHRPIREWDLASAEAGSDAPALSPDARGIAYLETVRGCPLHCLYCRYHHLRRRLSYLPPALIARQLELLRQRGTRHVRIIDPTFNAHPQFDEVLEAFVRRKKRSSMTFFAELRADRLTRHQADALARAGFTEIEVGVQSTDPAVLRAIGRPTDLGRLEQGIRLLTDRGIRVSLDLMIGLPFQTRTSVLNDLQWALRMPRLVRIQFLHTLLLPGTALRRHAATYGLQADSRPPYAVQETRWLPLDDRHDLEEELSAHPRLETDIPTRCWVGRRLPDLFPHRRLVEIEREPFRFPDPEYAREAWIFKGRNLYARRNRLAALIQHAIRHSPHTLWQFVLAPADEEPLDLLDELIRLLRSAPPHLNDRYPAMRLRQRMVSRRLMVLLPQRPPFSDSWIAEADATLRDAFY